MRYAVLFRSIVILSPYTGSFSWVMQFGTLPKPSVLNWGTEYRPDQCYSRLSAIACVLYELIHEQLPLPVPCYDLFPVTELTVGPPYGEISGTPGSLELTGGEYKTWERIHRGLADPRLLAIPASRSRVADSYPNWGYFYKDLLRVASSLPVVVVIVLCVWPKVSKGHADLASSSPSSQNRTRKT